MFLLVSMSDRIAHLQAASGQHINSPDRKRGMTDLISSHAGPAVDAPVPVMSVGPVVLPARGRGDDLQVRVSAPVTGHGLPVIVFSHGNGSSMRDYGPLVDHWAAHGFAVIQPTHLDSRMLNLDPQDPRFSERWRFRVNALH